MQQVVYANDNGVGVALRPPWAGAPGIGDNVNQLLMQDIMDGMVSRQRKDSNGIPTSLCDLGYCNVRIVTLRLQPQG